MSQFLNSLRTSNGKPVKDIKKKKTILPSIIVEEIPEYVKKVDPPQDVVEKIVIKEVEKIVYVKPVQKLVISKCTNKIEFIVNKLIAPSKIENSENFILLPKKIPIQSLGKQVYLRFKLAENNKIVIY